MIYGLGVLFWYFHKQLVLVNSPSFFSGGHFYFTNLLHSSNSLLTFTFYGKLLSGHQKRVLPI